MRFSIILPRPDEPDAGPESLIAAAHAVEAAGLDACSLTDHPFPVVDETRTGHHALDPFVALAFIAQATTRLRLHTNIVVLPYRNPFIVAKAASTLDHLSGGRLILGVGAGYLRPEFAALGVDFDRRNELTEEGVRGLTAAWTGAEVNLSGENWAAAGNSMLPRPASAPHPPIWMGGNSRRAIERAVELCQGWSPYDVPWPRSRDTGTRSIGSNDDLRRRIAEFRRVLEERGREDTLDLCFVRGRTDWLDGSRDQVLGELEELREMGLTWFALRLSASSSADFVEKVAAFGELVGR
jgi:probable F420-dependent oxidoreductase